MPQDNNNSQESEVYLARYVDETLYNLALSQDFPVAPYAGDITSLTQLGFNFTSDFFDGPEDNHQAAYYANNTPLAKTFNPKEASYSASYSSDTKITPPIIPFRPFTKPPYFVVLHWTGGASAGGAVSTLRTRGLSYHAIIERSGNVIQCIDYNSRGAHSKPGYSPERSGFGASVNSVSIGISFVNIGNETGDYPTEQRYAAYKLINELKRIHPLRLITGHVYLNKDKRDPIDYPWAEAESETGLTFWKSPEYTPGPARGMRRRK